MTGTESTFDALKRIIAPFNADGVPITPATDISADLNIDSVTVMDFVMLVEDHFDIEIPLNALSETRTMADLASVVDTRKSPA